MLNITIISLTSRLYNIVLKTMQFVDDQALFLAENHYVRWNVWQCPFYDHMIRCDWTTYVRSCMLRYCNAQQAEPSPKHQSKLHACLARTGEIPPCWILKTCDWTLVGGSFGTVWNLHIFLRRWFRAKERMEYQVSHIATIYKNFLQYSYSPPYAYPILFMKIVCASSCS